MHELISWRNSRMTSWCKACLNKKLFVFSRIMVNKYQLKSYNNQIIGYLVQPMYYESSNPTTNREIIVHTTVVLYKFSWYSMVNVYWCIYNLTCDPSIDLDVYILFSRWSTSYFGDEDLGILGSHEMRTKIWFYPLKWDDA